MRETPVRSTTWILAAALLCGAVTARGAADDKNKKASLSLKVSPQLAIAPAKARAVAELKGGPDDNAELYCPQAVWEWGDETTSEQSADCEPYESGRTTIARRFTAEHTYRYGGMYKVTVRLKQKGRVVATASTNFQVQGGISEQ